MASTASSVAPWIAPTWVLISSVALLACPARLFTSVATTRNPLPVSPARATSMVAFSANKFVYLAISLISSTNLPMSCADPERLSTLSFAPCVLCNISRTFVRQSTHLVFLPPIHVYWSAQNVSLPHFHRRSRHPFRDVCDYRNLLRNSWPYGSFQRRSPRADFRPIEFSCYRDAPDRPDRPHRWWQFAANALTSHT